MFSIGLPIYWQDACEQYEYHHHQGFRHGENAIPNELS
jgi:hypothetical protein